MTILEQVRGYWTALCHDGLPPLRSDIAPRGIAGALEYCLVAERTATGNTVIRIAGMGLAEIAGVDLSGASLLSLFDTPDRATAAQVLDRLFDTPATADLWLEALRGPGRPPLCARLMLLPLRGADGAVRMLLGCLAATGQVGTPPRRFAIARRVLRDMDGAATPACAGPAAPCSPAPHLRVIRAAQ